MNQSYKRKSVSLFAHTYTINPRINVLLLAYMLGRCAFIRIPVNQLSRVWDIMTFGSGSTFPWTKVINGENRYKGVPRT